MAGAVLAVGIAAGLLVFHQERARAAPESGKQQTQQTAVPVFATRAKTADVPIILRGIGAVQAFNTVQIKSRVDGNIVEVAYKEGQEVKAGDLLVQIDPRPYQAALDEAKGNQAKDQATLANAQLKLARDAAIVGSNLAVTRQQYDNEKAAVASDQATVEADQAAVEAAQVNLDYAAIRSPITGRTGRRQIDIGNLVQANGPTPLVVVTQMKPIFVTFSLPGADLTRIREQMAQHPLAVEAFDAADAKQVAEGRLTLVDNQVDQTTGMVTLKATFANDDEILWPGAFINAHLVLETVKNAVTVPSSAIQMGPSGAYVYAIKPDSTVELRPVTVTQVENNTALVGKGVAAGDAVVVSGQTGLYPGARVKVQQGAPGQANAQEPEIGPEGVGSTGVNTPVAGAGGGVNPR
ncbi:MAG TPA: efflux RND transporter periplasmic adaptor subunit [Stellaceae bacterium]|nr:efflux RND transporter periplasmic adaptor subunit [Stellaceae bacterium]